MNAEDSTGRNDSRTVKLIIEYDGTDFSGWQAQENGPSIQVAIEKAIFLITGERLRIVGSGRTDAGVHALGQVATFRTSSTVPGQRFAAALNAKLPKSITITSSCDVSGEFHPGKNATSKKYRFRILNRLMRPALLNNRVFHFPPELDIAAMREAAGHLIGKHDFKSFTVASSIKEAGYVREIYSLEVLTTGQEVIIEISGSGFLHNMVRIIAGTLLDVGRGRLKPVDMPEIIRACNRKASGPTLPGNGLYLVEVKYAEDTPSE